MSQEQLAAAAGLDRSFISLVERGIQSPNIVVLLNVAEVLKVSPTEIIKRTESVLAECAKEAPKSSVLFVSWTGARDAVFLHGVSGSIGEIYCSTQRFQFLVPTTRPFALTSDRLRHLGLCGLAQLIFSLPAFFADSSTLVEYGRNALGQIIILHLDIFQRNRWWQIRRANGRAGW